MGTDKTGTFLPAVLFEESVISDISHDLKSPLTAMLGLCELLLSDSFGAITAEQREAITSMLGATEHLEEGINVMASLLRMQAGYLKVRLRPVTLPSILQALEHIVTPLALRKKVILEVTCDVKSKIDADETLLRDLVFQAIVTTVRATKAGGKVLLNAEIQEQLILTLQSEGVVTFTNETISQWQLGMTPVARYVECYGGTMEMQSEKPLFVRISLPIHRGKPDDQK